METEHIAKIVYSKEKIKRQKDILNHIENRISLISLIFIFIIIIGIFTIICADIFKPNFDLSKMDENFLIYALKPYISFKFLSCLVFIWISLAHFICIYDFINKVFNFIYLNIFYYIFFDYKKYNKKQANLYSSFKYAFLTNNFKKTPDKISIKNQNGIIEVDNVFKLNKYTIKSNLECDIIIDLTDNKNYISKDFMEKQNNNINKINKSMLKETFLHLKIEDTDLQNNKHMI